MSQRIEIVLFPRFDELDAIGPFEVFENGARAGADLETVLVTLEPADTVEASHGLVVEPEDTLGHPDVVVVPGGGWTSPNGGVRQVIDDDRFLDAIADAHANGATIASVCTGGMILAHAGLLEGRPAVTHHDALADLEAYAAVRDARVVDDGDVLTAGGVTAGIDLALWLLEREHSGSVADQVAREMEHVRRGDVYR